MTLEEAYLMLPLLKKGTDMWADCFCTDASPFVSKMIESIYSKTMHKELSGEYLYGKRWSHVFTTVHCPKKSSIYAAAFCKMDDLEMFFKTSHYMYSIETFFSASELYLAGCATSSAKREVVLFDLLTGIYGEDDSLWYEDGIRECAEYLYDYIHGMDMSRYADMPYTKFLSVANYMSTILSRIRSDAGNPPEELFKKMLPELLRFFFHINLDGETDAILPESNCFIISGRNIAVYHHDSALKNSKLKEVMDAALKIIECPIPYTAMSVYQDEGFQVTIYYCDRVLKEDIHPLYHLAETIFDCLFPLWEFSQSKIPTTSADVLLHPISR